MSAFVVNPSHICALVHWSVTPKPGHYPGAGRAPLRYYWNGSSHQISGNEQRVASVLHAANVRSVNARYQDNISADGFKYRAPTSSKLRNLSPIQILKANHCYAYQACETDDWQQSEAFAIIAAIEQEAICTLPGYDAADYELID